MTSKLEYVNFGNVNNDDLKNECSNLLEYSHSIHLLIGFTKEQISNIGIVYGGHEEPLLPLTQGITQLLKDYLSLNEQLLSIYRQVNSIIEHLNNNIDSPA